MVDRKKQSALISTFNELKDKWKQETMLLSDPELIYENTNYKRIIKLGASVVPILIEDLKENDNDWLFALYQILKINPVHENHIGAFDLMKNDWLNWVNTNLGNRYAYHD